MTPDEELTHILKSSGFPANTNKIELLLEYKRLFLEWNEKTNLISRNTVPAFNRIHLLDCLLPLHRLPHTGPLVDLGSGGGLPGIIIKIMRPETEIALAETRDRKIKFLQSVIDSLNLEGIRTLDPSREKPEKRYRLLVSRAFGPLARILREAKKYLTEDGTIFAYKGRLSTVNDELNEVPDIWTRDIYSYPGPSETESDSEPERSIVILRRHHG